MKTMPKLSSEERRAAIVHAVRRVFAEKGFDGTTTRALAEAAGVSEALLYRHFPNKEALYLAMQLSCCTEQDLGRYERIGALEPSASTLVLLVHFLVGRFAGRIGKRIESVSRETMALLMAYPWPGNVRELENVLERAVILSSEPILDIDPEMLPVPPEAPAASPENTRLEDVQRSHIWEVLNQTNWVIEGPRGAAHGFPPE